MRRSAAFEIAGAAFSTLVSGWLIVRTKGDASTVFISAVVLLFSGAWLAHFFSARAGLYRACGAATEDYIALTRKRLATERRWARFARRWISLILLLIIPWACFTFYKHFGAYRAEPWRAIVGFGTAGLIFAALFVLLGRKARRLDAEGELLEQQLAEQVL